MAETTLPPPPPRPPEAQQVWPRRVGQQQPMQTVCDAYNAPACKSCWLHMGGGGCNIVAPGTTTNTLDWRLWWGVRDCYLRREEYVPHACKGGVGLGWVKASPGRLPTVRAAFPAGPDWAAVPGCPVTRPAGLLTAPRPRGGARGREMPPCLCVCALVCLRGGGGLWHTCLLHCCSALAHMAREGGGTWHDWGQTRTP